MYLNRPGTDTFTQLDDLVLLAGTGELVYCGPAKTAPAHFASMGHQCPPGESPGRFLCERVLSLACSLSPCCSTSSLVISLAL